MVRFWKLGLSKSWPLWLRHFPGKKKASCELSVCPEHLMAAVWASFLMGAPDKNKQNYKITSQFFVLSMISSFDAFPALRTEGQPQDLFVCRRSNPHMHFPWKFLMKENKSDGWTTTQSRFFTPGLCNGLRNLGWSSPDCSSYPVSHIWLSICWAITLQPLILWFQVSVK